MLDCQQTVVPPPANQSLPKLPPNEVLGFMSNRVQEQLKSALEKLSVIYKWTDSNSGLQARQLFHQYQDTVWPLLIESDERLKELASYLRQSIDSCSLKDARLEHLLALNRQHVECVQICSDLSGHLNNELEVVLDLRSRAAKLQGVQLSQDSMEKLEELREKIDKMSE